MDPKDCVRCNAPYLCVIACPNNAILDRMPAPDWSQPCQDLDDTEESTLIVENETIQSADK